MSEIGIVGDAPITVVSAAGTLSDLDGTNRFDWWIGADDRWHHAAEEPAVRQALGADEVTIETRLRIPGGDAVQRLAAVPDKGSSVVLVEIENDTPVPFALGLVWSGPQSQVRVYDDTVALDGVPVMRASRSVARVVVADTVEAAREAVQAGAAVPPSELDWPRPGAVVVAIFPLPHTAVLRCATGRHGSAAMSIPDDLPPIDAVARGWDAHLAGGARVSIPDDRLSRIVDAARRHLLVGSALPASSPFWTAGTEPWAPAVAATALDAWGHDVQARELLLAASGADDLAVHAQRTVAEAGALLWAWAERLERRPDAELEHVLGPWIEEVAVSLMRRPSRFGRRKWQPGDEAWRAVGLASAGSLLSRFGDNTVGPDIVDALPELVGDIIDEPASVALALGAPRLGRVSSPLAPFLLTLLGVDAGSNPFAALAALANPVGAIGLAERSQHPAVSALVLHAVRRALVDEPEGTGGRVAVLSAPDPGWLGASIEAHGMPVTGGHLAFAARWHGDRPALLWDMSGPPGRSITVPGLDASWAHDDLKGEALLEPTTGLDLRDAPTSAEVRRGESLDVDTDDDPDSFV